MISGVLASASPQTFSSSSSLLSKPKANCNCYATSSVSVHTLCSSDLKLKGIGLYGTKGSRRSRVHCNSSTGPGGPGSGDGDSRSVLDAFFLGKALAEALNERIESSVGEFLSTIGRLQAEQQKQVEEFQEDVLQRAKRAKEKAAREAMEAQGLISKSTKKNTTPVSNGVAPVTSTTTNTVTPVSKPSLSEPALSTTKDEQDPTNQDTVLGVPNDD